MNMIEAKRISKLVSKSLTGAAQAAPDWAIQNGIIGHLTETMKTRTDLNSFIACLRSNMSNKLKDGIQ